MKCKTTVANEYVVVGDAGIPAIDVTGRDDVINVDGTNVRVLTVGLDDVSAVLNTAKYEVPAVGIVNDTQPDRQLYPLHDRMLLLDRYDDYIHE